MNLWTSWRNEYEFMTKTSNGCVTTTIKVSSSLLMNYSKCVEKLENSRYFNLLLFHEVHPKT